MRNARRRVYGWGASGLAAVLVRVPYPVLRGLCRLTLPPIQWVFLRRAAHRNLSAVYGEAMTARERRALLRIVFRNLSTVPAECLCLAARGAGFFERCVDDSEARAKMHAFERAWGKGWVGITGHVGNWEMMGSWIHHYALCPMLGGVAKRQPNPHLDRLIVDMRRRGGMRTVYRDEPASVILRALKAGGTIGLVPDQDVRHVAGAFLDFLGRPAYTPLGPARLAVAAGVPIIAAFMLREGGRFRVWMSDPMYPDPTRPKRAEVLRLTQQWSALMEDVVRAYPEQWPWFHDRWKTTPERLARKNRSAIDMTGRLPSPTARTGRVPRATGSGTPGS